MNKVWIGGGIDTTIRGKYGLDDTFLVKSDGESLHNKPIAPICNAVHFELIILLERLHALYFSVYSKQDKLVHIRVGHIRTAYHDLLKKTHISNSLASNTILNCVPNYGEAHKATSIGKSPA
jgi:hypothetical protein